MDDKQSKVGEELENTQSNVGEERIGTAQAAKMLGGISQQAVRNAIEEGRLEGDKELHGARVKFTTTKEAVERYRERRTAVSVRKIDEEAIQTFAKMLGEEIGPVLDFWKRYGGRMMDTHESHSDLLREQGKKIDNLCETLGETNDLMRRLIENEEKKESHLEEIKAHKERQEEERRGFWAWLTGG